MAKSHFLDRSPTHLLHRASQVAEQIFAAEMVPGDLTPRQLAVLLAVVSTDSPSQKVLTERTGIDHASIADIVTRMQRKKLLQRRRTKEDRRTYAVKLTDEGRQVLSAAEPLAKRIDDRVLAALP